MTKFEEEFDKNVHVTSDMLTGRKICSANQAKALGHGWVSPEAHQARVNELIAAKEENIELLRKNATLKSQLQQQALPVVPEFVAKTVELLKKNPESSWSKLYSSLGEEGVTWLNDFQHKDERFGFGGLNSKLFVLFHLAINGYTVEKPQLFYLKNKLTGLYLYRRDKVSFGEQDYCKDRDDKPLAYCLFTQKEIGSMQTGSYEQIEVEK